MEAFLAALRQRCRGASQSSPEKISRPQKRVSCLVELFGRDELEEFRRGVEPVSYTHLTLPTILLV
eukprot:5558675-Pyramimonas_sp.AAC.1